MRRPHYRLAAALAVALVATAAAPAAPLDEMLKDLPDSCNAVFLVNFRAIINSPLGVSRGWGQRNQQNFAAGMTSLPPITDRALVGMHIDPSTLHHTWKIKMLQLTQDVPMEQIASHEQATLEKVSGFPVVLSRGEYFVGLSPRRIAEAHPADRQKLSRWLAFCKSNTKPVLSQYLQDAVGGAGLGAQAMIAVDLQDVFDIDGIRRRIKGATWLEGKKVNTEAVILALSNIVGLKVNIRVEKEIEGEIRLDFSESADALAPIAKEFILGVMQNMGAALDDIQSWKPSIQVNAILLRGTLTERGAKLLLSPVDNQLTGTAYTGTGPAKPAAPGTPGADPKAMASLMYYRSLTTLLDELRNERNTKSISQRGYWYQQYAAKIDSLPLLNVDPDLLKFGAALSQTLRKMANVGQIVKRQNETIQANQLDYVPTVQPTNWGGGGGYGPYGGYGWGYTTYQQGYTSNYGQIRDMCTSNANNEKAFREATWSNIDNGLAELRRKMTEKHMVQF
jgi:hypothetical protein